MSRFVACTHDVYLGESCAECTARLAADDTTVRLDAQRDTLLAQSARLDELYDQLRILEARIADQHAEIVKLKSEALIDRADLHALKRCAGPGFDRLIAQVQALARHVGIELP